MDHETAIRWVAALNQADGGHGYLGQTDWDLSETGAPDPSCSMKGTTGYGCVGSAMGSLFYRQQRLPGHKHGGECPLCEVYYPESSAGQPAPNRPPSQSLPHS
jgi:hypothetical protein